MEYSDIHTHILFGIDDGAPSLETSLQMLDMAYAGGTRLIIFTPHGDSRYKYGRASAAAEELLPLIKERYPELSVFSGCEIFYGDYTVGLLNSGKLPTLAGSHYVLVEFSPGDKAQTLLDAVRTLTSNGYLPVIAHAERYSCTSPALVSELINSGAYIQLNASSVLGKHGFGAKRLCAKLLKLRLVHFIASDAHDVTHRVPLLDECAKYVAGRYGESFAERIFCKNGVRITENIII